MPRNSSGVYTLPLPPVVPGTTITSTWANTTLDDVTAGLTDSLDRYGRGGMVAPFRLIDGTEALPAFAFNAETGSGLYRESTGVVAMSVLGTARQEWTAAGIVFLSPVAFAGNATINGDLEVTGDILADGNLGALGNFGVAGTSSFVGLSTFGNTTVNGLLTVNGGIFTSSPPITITGGGLTVQGALTAQGAFQAQGGTTLGDSSTDLLTFNSNVLNLPNNLRISGLLGINITPDPSFALFSSGPIAVQNTGFNFRALNTAGNGGGSFNANVGTAGGITLSADAGPMMLVAGGSERMRINTSGYVGIGTVPVAPGLTVRDDAAGGLLRLTNKSVSGSTHLFGAVLFDAFRDVSDPSHVAAIWADGTSPAGNQTDLHLGVLQNGGSGLPTERMRIAQNGNVAIGTGFAPASLLHLQATGGLNLQIESLSTGSSGMIIRAPSAAGPYSAQIAFYDSATARYAIGAGNVGTGGPTDFSLYSYVVGRVVFQAAGATGVLTEQNGLELGWRRMPASAVVSGDVGPTDVGKTVWATGNINIPNGMTGVSRGDAITIMSDTNSSITITPTGGMTMYLAGGAGSIGARTLVGRGVATVVFGNNTYSVITGNIS